MTNKLFDLDPTFDFLLDPELFIFEKYEKQNKEYYHTN